MELVTFNEETKKWEENNSSSSYDYVAGTEGEDNNKGKWANVRVTIDGVESYFVWIPRYAYKITYNNPENKSEGGTIDVKFLIGTSDNYYDEKGELQKAERAVTGKEDTTSAYYVHPAFTNNVDLGGWDSELTGIWIGKYESSLVNKTNGNNIVPENQLTNIIVDKTDNTDKAIAIQPGMSSWRNCIIGNMYSSAKSYSENLSSHMLKNSEWGAVAYLSHSQYGRNGKEVITNANTNYITADNGISINPEQSTTGNIYGIYDFSGGAYEYLASYFEIGTKENANQIMNEKEKKYITEYDGSKENDKYKIGDATDETPKWYDDAFGIIGTDGPFFSRGGEHSNGISAGIFSFRWSVGDTAYNSSFRIALII